MILPFVINCVNVRIPPECRVRCMVEWTCSVIIGHSLSIQQLISSRINMLMVPTEVRSSNIHGLGVFALTNIPKGTLIWTFREGFDNVIPTETLRTFPECIQIFIRKYGYRDNRHPDGYVMCNDDARFMNHAVPSNTDNCSGLFMFFKHSFC